jgi:hypothetical protein
MDLVDVDNKMSINKTLDAIEALASKLPADDLPPRRLMRKPGCNENVFYSLQRDCWFDSDEF